MSGNARHANILEARLLTEEVELLAEAVASAVAVGPGSMSLDGLGTRRGQRKLNEGDRV